MILWALRRPFCSVVLHFEGCSERVAARYSSDKEEGAVAHDNVAVRLTDERHYGPALLVAQMACEVAIGRAIVSLLERRGYANASDWADTHYGGFSFLPEEAHIFVAFATWSSLAGWSDSP